MNWENVVGGGMIISFFLWAAWMKLKYVFTNRQPLKLLGGLILCLVWLYVGMRLLTN